MNNISKELAGTVVAHNSEEKNLVCCIEEMSELTKVLTKKLRNSPKFNKHDLLEEISHVLLMCNAVAIKYDLDEDDILREQLDAVRRMRNAE